MFVNLIRSAMSGMAASLLSFCLFPAPADADLVTQRVTDAPTLKEGQTLPDDYEFELSEGAEILLLQTPSGESFYIRGPFKGTLEAYNEDCNSWLAFAYSYCASEAGDRLPVGGTRGAPVSADE